MARTRAKKRSPVKKIVAAGGCNCTPCSTADGFKFCYDGNEIILTDFPTTGGPWMPAIYPNGQHTWVNAAAFGAAKPTSKRKR